MKLRSALLYILFALLICSCKKDLGNYKYNAPSEPVLDGFDGSTVDALVGDTLTVRPYVYLQGANPAKDLTFDWDIFVDEEARADHYTGYPLKIVYNLAPKLRNAKLTITDNRNQIKYFYSFKIQGGTQFSAGTAVLSLQDGITKLSFVKADNKTVLSDLYYALHKENLPENPVQLFPKPVTYNAGSVEDYWVICHDPKKNSVIIDGSTMLRKKYFQDQFFNAPATISTDYFEASAGTPTGVINGKLYLSIVSTAPFAPDFGKFSNSQPGQYTLSPFFIRTPAFFFGYDPVAKAFISFDSGGNYMGSDYKVSGVGFNPTKINLGNLLFMQAVPSISYAFFEGAEGDNNIYELSFSVDMMDYQNRTVKAIYKRVFKGSSLIKPDTKWQKSAVDVFYFTSNDKIYRYNPVNEELRALDADFGGKKVTMIKLSTTTEGDVLTAGVDGSLMLLDVSVGKNGNITKVITGIPGSPVDIVTRKN